MSVPLNKQKSPHRGLFCNCLRKLEAGTAICLGFSNVDAQRAAFEVFAIEHFDSLLSLFSCGHLDKAEAAAAAGFAVGNNRSGNDLASASKVITKSVTGCAVGKVSYVQGLVHN